VGGLSGLVGVFIDGESPKNEEIFIGHLSSVIQFVAINPIYSSILDE